jgi:hypothetical protein
MRLTRLRDVFSIPAVLLAITFGTALAVMPSALKKAQIDTLTPKTSVGRLIAVPDIDSHSAQRLWDFAARNELIYFLIANSSFSDEIVVTDTNETIKQRIPISLRRRCSSGKISVSADGMIAVLLRPPNGVAEILVFTGKGALISDTVLDRYVYEICFWGSSLVGGTGDGFVSLNMFKGEAIGQSFSIKEPLSTPFALLPVSADRLAAFEFLENRWFQLHKGTRESIATNQTPELNERSKEQADEGVAVVVDAATDSKGNVYMLLPNFKAATVFRILKLNSGGRKIDLLQIPMQHSAETGRHIHPRLIRVEQNQYFSAFFNSNQLLIGSF